MSEGDGSGGTLADLAGKPIVASVTLGLVQVARVVVDCLVGYSDAFRTLSKDASEWSSDKAIVTPVSFCVLATLDQGPFTDMLDAFSDCHSHISRESVDRNLVRSRVVLPRHRAPTRSRLCSCSHPSAYSPPLQSPALHAFTPRLQRHTNARGGAPAFIDAACAVACEADEYRHAEGDHGRARRRFVELVGQGRECGRQDDCCGWQGRVWVGLDNYEQGGGSERCGAGRAG